MPNISSINPTNELNIIFPINAIPITMLNAVPEFSGKALAVYPNITGKEEAIPTPITAVAASPANKELLY